MKIPTRKLTESPSIRNFCQRAVKSVKIDEASVKQIDYYSLQYKIGLFIDPIVSPLFSNTPPLVRFAVTTFLAHPQIVYFNRIWDKGVLSSIWRGNLNGYEFIKSEISGLKDQKIQRQILESLLAAYKAAIIGPLITYWTLCFLPSTLDPMVHCMQGNVIRTIMAYVIFQCNPNLSTLYKLLPMMLIAGSFRGIIFFSASEYFKNLGFDGKNVFYLSMIVRCIFEGEVKKVEKMDLNKLYQFLTRNFSAS